MRVYMCIYLQIYVHVLCNSVKKEREKSLSWVFLVQFVRELVFAEFYWNQT